MSARAPSSPGRRFAVAWGLLVLALAAHVADEALHDFLSVYNPLVESVRARVPWFPAPTFTFGTWLSGLVVGVLLLAALLPAAARDAAAMRVFAAAFAVLMALNGLGHIVASVAWGYPVPGVVSAPFLLAASAYVLWVVGRSARARKAAAP